MNDTSKVLIATVSGAALGIAAGMLIAPKSGKETRDGLSASVKKARKDIDNLVSRTKKASTEMKNDAKAKINNIKEAAAKS